MKATLKRWRDTSAAMEPLCRLLRATGLVPPRIWQHLGFSGTADFHVGGRKVAMWNFGAEIENSLFWAGYGEGWEATTLLAWERLAAESSVIFDVGANTGLFALAAQAINPGASVHAFEPLPAIAARLADNVALNRFPIVVHAVAVSDHDGVAAIQMSHSAHEYSASFEHMAWMDDAPVITIEVAVARLATVIAQSGERPDLIKIDVERHEPQALRGLWDAVSAGPPPALVIEILDDECAAAAAHEVANRGYSSYVIRENVGIAAAELRFEPGTMNWLLLPGSAGGFAEQLRAGGGMSHCDLRAARPLHPVCQ